MLNDFIPVNITFLDFHTTCQFVQDALYFLFVYGLNRFSHQLPGIAVSNRLVVVVGMNILSEYTPRLSFFFQERRSCQCNLHCIFVCFEQIGEKTALWVVATVSFIDEENTLQMGVVIAVNLNFLLVLLEFLDVDNHDFKFTVAVLRNSSVTDVVHQFVPTFCIADDKPSGGKLIRCLFHQVDSIHNEIELCNGILLGKVICQAFY